jgi:cytochrome c oxidase subunit II
VGDNIVGRFWSLLFLAVPILGVGVFIWAMAGWWPMQGHWLPENINQHGAVIDNLFMFILYLTGVIFVGTSLALFWFMWVYDRQYSNQPVKYMHGSHTLEVVWSILPAATLLFIAIYQMNAWANHKMRRPILDIGADKIEYTADDVYQAPLAEVAGRQFEWRIRYAGKDGLVGSQDDIRVVNDLHVPINEEVVLSIKSQDVLHSFFLPHLRLKQDVVPGMKQHVWFKATKAGQYDIVCAELCGWGHYKMRGRITVESREKYEKWLSQQWELQEQSSYVPPVKEESDE